MTLLKLVKNKEVYKHRDSVKSENGKIIFLDKKKRFVILKN